MIIEVVKVGKYWRCLVEIRGRKYGRDFLCKRDALRVKEDLEKAGEDRVVTIYGLDHFLAPIEKLGERR